MSDRYSIYPVKYVPTNLLVEYWQSMQDAGLLGLRLGDTINPTIADVYEMIKKNEEYNHYVIDKETLKVVGEFLVHTISGKIGDVHFSVAPNLSLKEAVYICRWATDKVLNEWSPKDKPGEPYLSSLVGLTPLLNRRACFFIQKVGFERIATIPEGCHYYGALATAVMTIKKSKRLTNEVSYGFKETESPASIC